MRKHDDFLSPSDNDHDWHHLDAFRNLNLITTTVTDSIKNPTLLVWEMYVYQSIFLLFHYVIEVIYYNIGSRHQFLSVLLE